MANTSQTPDLRAWREHRFGVKTANHKQENRKKAFSDPGNYSLVLTRPRQFHS